MWLSQNSAVGRALLYVFPDDCFDEMVVHFNVVHERCMPIVLSRFLGLGITLGALMGANLCSELALFVLIHRILQCSCRRSSKSQEQATRGAFRFRQCC